MRGNLRPFTFVFAAAVLAAGFVSAPRVAAKPGHEPGELFFARPNGAKEELVAYNTSTGHLVFTLPAGMLAADGRRYFSTARTETGTLLRWHWLDPLDTAGGGVIRFPLDGDWTWPAPRPPAAGWR